MRTVIQESASYRLTVATSNVRGKVSVSFLTFIHHATRPGEQTKLQLTLTAAEVAALIGALQQSIDKEGRVAI